MTERSLGRSSAVQILSTSTGSLTNSSYTTWIALLDETNKRWEGSLLLSTYSWCTLRENKPIDTSLKMHNVEPPSGYFELCARPSARLSCDDGYYVVTAFPQVFPSEEGRASLCGATETGKENQKERGGNELTSPSLLCAYCIVCTQSYTAVLIRIVAEPTGRLHHYYYYEFMYALDISLYHLSYVYIFSCFSIKERRERDKRLEVRWWVVLTLSSKTRPLSGKKEQYKPCGPKYRRVVRPPRSIYFEHCVYFYIPYMRVANILFLGPEF